MDTGNGSVSEPITERIRRPQVCPIRERVREGRDGRRDCCWRRFPVV